MFNKFDTPRVGKTRWDGEKIPPLTQEEMIAKYGATPKAADTNKPEILIKKPETNVGYDSLSNEQLEDKFYRARERMKSDVLMNNHDSLSKSDYADYYQPLLKEMEKRGLSVTQEIKSVENLRMGSKAEYRNYGNKIVEAIDENIEMVEEILSQKQQMDRLESAARESFRNMLSFPKGSGERVAAYEDWMSKRNAVIVFEDKLKQNTIEDTPVKNLDQDSGDMETYTAA